MVAAIVDHISCVKGDLEKKILETGCCARMSFELNISAMAVVFAFSRTWVNYISDKIEFEFFNYGQKT